MNLDFKEIVGIILLIASFGYLILNPSQSMIDGLMKQRKKKYEKLQEEAAAKAAAAEADAEVIED